MEILDNGDGFERRFLEEIFTRKRMLISGESWTKKRRSASERDKTTQTVNSTLHGKRSISLPSIPEESLAVSFAKLVWLS